MKADKYLTYSPLLPLRKSGAHLPLFCIHPGGGSGTVYKRLTDALSIEQPVWALEARGLVANETYHATLDEMVKDYVAAVREVQPTGPYNLLGYSFGGIVAHEMACVLELQNETVSSVILLDVQTDFVGSDNRQLHEKQLLRNMIDDLDFDPEICSIDNDLFIAKVKDHLVAAGVTPEATPMDMVRRMLTQTINCQILLSDHRVKKCQAPILLFRANEESPGDDIKSFDWRSHTSSEVEIVNIQARHGDILSRNSSVPLVAKEIDRYLEKVNHLCNKN